MFWFSDHMPFPAHEAAVPESFVKHKLTARLLRHVIFTALLGIASAEAAASGGFMHGAQCLKDLATLEIHKDEQSSQSPILDRLDGGSGAAEMFVRLNIPVRFFRPFKAVQGEAVAKVDIDCKGRIAILGLNKAGGTLAFLTMVEADSFTPLPGIDGARPEQIDGGTKPWQMAGLFKRVNQSH